MLVSDGDFTSWSSFSFVTDDPTVVTPGPGTSTGSAVTVPTGGNPGAYLSLSETFTTGDTIWTGGIKTDYTYDPATQGALTSLGIKVDLRDPTFGATRATAWLLVVSQGGKRYTLFRLMLMLTAASWPRFQRTISHRLLSTPIRGQVILGSSPMASPPTLPQWHSARIWVHDWK